MTLEDKDNTLNPSPAEVAAEESHSLEYVKGKGQAKYDLVLVELKKAGYTKNTNTSQPYKSRNANSYCISRWFAGVNEKGDKLPNVQKFFYFKELNKAKSFRNKLAANFIYDLEARDITAELKAWKDAGYTEYSPVKPQYNEVNKEAGQYHYFLFGPDKERVHEAFSFKNDEHLKSIQQELKDTFKLYSKYRGEYGKHGDKLQKLKEDGYTEFTIRKRPTKHKNANGYQTELLFRGTDKEGNKIKLRKKFSFKKFEDAHKFINKDVSEIFERRMPDERVTISDIMSALSQHASSQERQ